jgi:Asp-tRNA(Asn)/Glu-tRNA(Gln) amidotransferase A subunit family amidase
MLTLAEHCRAAMALVWEDHDILLTPAAIGEAPVGWDAFVGADLYKMWSVLHVPALTLPLFEGPNGMPVGLQLFAERRRDRQLFAQALWVYRRLT